MWQKIWLRHLEKIRSCKRLVYCAAWPLHSSSLWLRCFTQSLITCVNRRLNYNSMIKQSNLAPADTHGDKLWKSALVWVICASFCTPHSFYWPINLRLITLLVLPKVKQLCSHVVHMHWLHSIRCNNSISSKLVGPNCQSAERSQPGSFPILLANVSLLSAWRQDVIYLHPVFVMYLLCSDSMNRISVGLHELLFFTFMLSCTASEKHPPLPPSSWFRSLFFI